MKKVLMAFAIALVATILVSSSVLTMNIAYVDAVKSSREKACANPRDPGEQDPKFCSHLIVIKNVAGGGTASPSQFTIHVTGNNVQPSTFAGSSSGTTVTLSQGSYQVTESTIADYTPTYSSDCSGSILAGQTKTCTITNTYTAQSQEPATLTVYKLVFGGTAQASDFIITLNLFQRIDGQCTPAIISQTFQGSEQGTTFTLQPDLYCGYTVTEYPQNGYGASVREQCGFPFIFPGQTISPGQTYRCTYDNILLGT